MEMKTRGEIVYCCRSWSCSVLQINIPILDEALVIAMHFI